MNGPDLQSPAEYSPAGAPAPLDLPTLDDARRAGALDTSPAWELELLISAAIVVGLFALPGIIERFFARIDPHATAAAQAPLMMLHIYLLSAAYALLVAFVVHFAARAYWVGLIGLNSVFPRGLRWDKLNTGPAVTQVYRARLREPRQLIERIDNFCSITFSFAFLIVIVLVFTIALMGISGGVAWGISHLFLGGQHIAALVEAVVIGYLLFSIAVVRMDKRIGPRLASDSASRRWLTRAATLVFYITPTAITGPILLTLTSNIGRRRMILTFQCAVFAVLVLAAADRLAHEDRLRVNSYSYFTANSSRSVDFRHYADTWQNGETVTGTAFIQSQVVSSPYVDLFIPYTPSEDNDAIAARCPRLAPLVKNGISLGRQAQIADTIAVQALGCLAAAHPVMLDGQPVQQPLDFYEDPATGLHGMLAHIPATPLAPGRHLLTVAALPVPADSAATTRGRQFIPFWR